jgi:hypothetical protein
MALSFPLPFPWQAPSARRVPALVAVAMLAAAEGPEPPPGR